MKKNLIYLLVALAVIILALVSVFLYKKGVIRPLAAGEIVTLQVDPVDGAHKVNDTFDVNIILNTGGAQTTGFQIKNLSFNPSILEVQDAVLSVSGDTSTDGVQILSNKVFGQPFSNLVDNIAGTINFAEGSSLGAAPFSGTNTSLAKITFKTLAPGTSPLNFDFTATYVGDTGAGNNILTSVTGGSYTISTPLGDPTVNLLVNDVAGPIEIDSGTAAALKWSSTNATGCTTSNGWTGDKGTSGEVSTGNLTTAKTYVLVCTNGTKSATGSVTVNIKGSPLLPDVTVRVDGKKSITIASGKSFTLTWQSTDATTCAASGSWSGAQKAAGSAAIGPMTQAKTYTLTCSNAVGSVHDTAIVYIENAPPPVVSAVNIKANNSDDPITIDYDAEATLTWESANADTCVASNGWDGDKAVTGEESTGKLTESKTYTLTCRKGDANAVDSVTVNVNGQQVAPPGPSDGNQTIVDQTTTTEPTDTTIAQVPGDNPAIAEPPVSSETLYKGGVIKPWAMWVFYILIPLTLTAGIVYIYLKRKREKMIKSSLNDLSNPPKDWPNSAV